MPKEGGEKTEKATPKRLKQARRDGHISNTPELGSWFGMLAASFVIPHVFKSLFNTATVALVQVGATIQDPDTHAAATAAEAALKSGMGAVLPMSMLMMLVGVASVAGQGGIWFSPKAFKPQFNRLNPLSGIKRMFGPHAGWQLVKSLLKTAALAVVVLFSVKNLIPTVHSSGTLPLATLMHIGISTVLNLIRFAAAAGILMAAADYAVVRRRNNKQTKMSKQEIKDEFKSSEGDPHIRGQRRARALAMARNRMMQDVKTADVVVVNPTHVAVALKYDPAKGAPRVVAKGADHVAAKIRELAELNRVPMVSDVPLARTLYKVCDIGQEIPADMYKAVATVLAFIMTLKKRGSAAGVHTVRTLAPAR